MKVVARETGGLGYPIGQRSPCSLRVGRLLAGESIEIRWPSGIVQTLANIDGDRQIQVDEPTVIKGAGLRAELPIAGEWNVCIKIIWFSKA